MKNCECLKLERLDGDLNSHHPDCLQSSIITVYKISDPLRENYYYTNDWQESMFCRGAGEFIVEEETMKQETYDNLPEFQGF